MVTYRRVEARMCLTAFSDRPSDLAVETCPCRSAAMTPKHVRRVNSHSWAGAWAIGYRAAAGERAVAVDLLDDDRPPAGLLPDRGFAGRAFAVTQAERGTRVVLTPGRTERRHGQPWASARNRSVA